MNSDQENASPANGEVPFAAKRRRVLVSLAGLALLGLVLYAILGQNGKDSGPRTSGEAAAKCTQSRELAQRLKPLTHGEVAALALASAPQPLPQLSFAGPDGKPRSLDDFRGRDVLLNLWATWCVPCRQEMPALDRLEGKLGGPQFEVVAVNIDTVRLDRPKAFLNDIGVKNLAFYSDSKADIFQVLKQDGKALGLPTTILVGKDGCEIGTMAGPAQWDSGDGLALIEALKRG